MAGDDFDENYGDNEPYEKALHRGQRPDALLKYGFCREMGLEILGEDHWFSVCRKPRTGQALLAIYTSVGLRAFHRACREKGVHSANVILGMPREMCSEIDPMKCKSLTYIGVFRLEPAIAVWRPYCVLQPRMALAKPKRRRICGEMRPVLAWCRLRTANYGYNQ